MGDKQLTPLSDTTKFIVDNRGKTVPTVENGIPLIATNCIKNNSLYPVYERIRYISQDTFDNWFRAHLEPNDIILTLKGSQNGAVCLVPDTLGFAIAQDMVGLRINEKVINPMYLFAVLRSKDIQTQIKNLDVSGVIPHLKKSDFNKLFIPRLEKEKENFIGKTYHDFCKKIDLLHCQNKTLEELAQTLFRKWFIKEAKDDWEAGTLGEVISIFDSKRVPLSKMKRDKLKTGILYPYYGAAKIMDYINDYIFDGEYILMGEDGTVRTEDGYPILQYATGKFWVNNHTHVLQAKEPYSNYFIWSYLLEKNIDEIVTGAVQPKINQTNLKSLNFPKYPLNKVLQFNEQANTLLEKINQNKVQIKTLENMRDTLLPKFISGEVSVKL
ncbi:restriction endonuclease subunit S [Poseidonibacter lekithochrous]|uniref:restriction endonuclease subunit S n=1 Tax=Poseidonibacter lekithochrous TaxID=1904463 RepID=UPI0008FC9986|nr:restriction endonuclease subunit S [Poseidonibacter lekithochrous]QKJ22301.1 type I restriction/modification system, specificity subunit [Poseidonibacter lekithochrous]